MSFNPVKTITDAIGLDQHKSYLDARNNIVLAEQGQEGISGFLFDVPETEVVSLTAEVTDHYTEGNSFLHDHRVIKPIQITLTGFIGELVHEVPSGLTAEFQKLDRGLQAVSAFMGEQTPQGLQAIQDAASKARAFVGQVEGVIDEVAGVIGKGKKVLAALDLLPPEPTKQQVAYKRLEALFLSRGLLTVQTPWNFYQNLMITAIRFTQEPESNSLSNISVTLKEVRFSEVKFSIDSGLVGLGGGERNSTQDTPMLDSGVVPSNQSFAHELVYG